ncbi:MAG: DeoR/GlpR transcriptional regulator [Spirochaetales bacterium]|nr:DeoR/GlpR transcriptional regulator [Candidatus Physcosoma equi]
MAQRSIIEERRRSVLEYINQNEKADLSELARHFDTTESTIRRDLIELENEDQIIRTHGGAIRMAQKKAVWQTSSIFNRLERNKLKKEKIAHFAANLLKDNESVFIDGGSTNQILAPYIRDKKDMLFVTNSPDIADILLEGESDKVIQIGGELKKDTHLTSGPVAEEYIRKYYVDKCVMSVTGIDPEVGCYAAIPSEASLKKTIVEHSRECILLVDSSKFERKAFCIAFETQDIDIVITDSDTPKDLLDRLRAKNVTVYVV